MAENKPRPFKVNVRQETLDWVTQRVESARVIPDAVNLPKDRDWEDGAPSTVMNELVEYLNWKNSYDWRKVEEKLNSTYKMFTLDIPEGDEVLQVHFVHLYITLARDQEPYFYYSHMDGLVTSRR